MSDTLKKLLVVVSLTLLIWTWAYMSQEMPDEITGMLQVADSTDPSLLVTFSLPGSRPQTKIPLAPITLRGAPSKLSELRTLHRSPLDFYYDPVEHNRTEGIYTLELLEYLQKSNKIQQLALTLESCTPSQVTVNITQLVEKELPVQCVDKDNIPLKGTNSNPSLVKVYVRKGYPVESATVVLSPQQIETARKQPVEATAYVELGIAGIRRQSQTPVQVELRPEERLKELPFQPTSIGLLISPEIARNSKVQLVNETKLTGRTLFNATTDAMEAYKKMSYHILIEIRDGDELLSDIPPRPVIYNFPPEYVRSGEIELAEQLPKLAEIKIEPLSPDTN